jgi:hypothetical protein
MAGRIGTGYILTAHRYLLPLQLAVDQAIARHSGFRGSFPKVSEYMYTSMTATEHDEYLMTR